MGGSAPDAEMEPAGGTATPPADGQPSGSTEAGPPAGRRQPGLSPSQLIRKAEAEAAARKEEKRRKREAEKERKRAPDLSPEQLRDEEGPAVDIDEIKDFKEFLEHLGFEDARDFQPEGFFRPKAG